MDWRKLAFKEGTELAGDSNPSQSAVKSSSVPVERSSYLGDPTTRTRGRSASVGTAPSSQPAAVDMQFDAELKAVLDRATTPGYREFLVQLEVLADVVPDENVRIQKALQSVEKMLHIDARQIVTAIQDRLDLLNQEKARFENGLSDELHEHIESNTKAVEDLGKQIAANDTELVRLKNEQARLGQDQQTAQSEIRRVQSEGEQVRIRYNSAFQPLQASLTAVLAKIQPRS